MKLNWQYKDFDSDIDFILFHQKDNTPIWWQKQLFKAYPDLNYEYARSLSEEKRFEYITSKMKIQAETRKQIIENSIQTFQNKWNSVSTKAEIAFSQAFNNDCRNILNDMVAYVGLNPICPRDIKTHSFDIYYYFDPTYAITTALHEITHFVWFYFWNKHFGDDTSEYDFPSIKWLLSEIVVETIIRNSDINDLIEQPKYIAYSYFYDMTTNGEQIFDIMKHLYLNRKDIYDFMDKAFEWITTNEPELRNKIQEAESK
ncbi:MAG: hypothetical protein J6T57_01825 [Alphaproteobacteria bacterium]|nr:hypothetical protein [Alphaproteobacteria bacterium]